MPSSQKQGAGILFLFAFVTVLLSSGLVYGWPALRRNLVHEGSSITENNLGLIFTVGSWSTQGGRFFFGIARDRYFGTRITAVTALILTALGFVGIAFADKNNVVALAISMFLVGLGSGAQLCVQPVAGLFPVKVQGSVLASLSGAFQITVLVFLILTSISENRLMVFGPYALILCLLALFAMKLLPKHQFVKVQKDLQKEVETDNAKEQMVSSVGGNMEDENDYEGGNRQISVEEGTDDIVSNKVEDDDIEVSEFWTDESGTKNEEDCDSGGAAEVRQAEGNIVIENEDNEPPDEKTDNPVTEHTNGDNKQGIDVSNEKGAVDQVCTWEYFLLVLWFSVVLIPLQYYVATIGFQLERKGDTGKYTSLFSILYASAAGFAPLVGKIADVAGLGVAQAIATSLSAASLFFLALDSVSLNIHTIGMASYALGRLMVVGMFFANVGKCFGYTHYGTLAGLGLIISAFLTLIQYPLITAAAGGSERLVNIICGTVMVCQGIPYCMWLGYQERASRDSSVGRFLVTAKAELVTT